LSSPIIQKLTNAQNSPKSIYLILQKQFARKLIASEQNFTSALGVKTFPFLNQKGIEEEKACFTKRFHFGIHYFINEDLSEIWIIAIIHTKRDINTQMLLSRISDIRNN